ncbi:MAG: hypothetical protein KF746_07075 [Chitinophagaceae bacterium]|nr:hypothetical protein [Chitinophagaceae bacterium]
MEIKKEDLVFNHYTWYDGTAGTRQDMSPTRNTFDRNNGAHILWIANWYITEYPGSEKADIAKLETLLSDKLPSGLMSEKSVCNWLANT